MSFPLTSSSPRFSGIQLIQVHGDQSAFPDHYSLKFVPYTPNDQVDLYNNRAFGDDQPTATYKNALVGRFSETKVNLGIIPNLAEAKKYLRLPLIMLLSLETLKRNFKQHWTGPPTW